MRKTTLIIGGVVAVAALWSAGWYAGRKFYVEPEADRQLAELQAGALTFDYDERTVGGFPFGYDVSYRGVRIGDSTRLWSWAASEVAFRSSVGNVGALKVFPSPGSRLTIEAAALGGEEGGAPVVFDVISEGLDVTLTSIPDGGSAVSIAAAALTVEQKAGEAPVRDATLRYEGLEAVSTFRDGAVGGSFHAAEMAMSYRFSLDQISETASSSTIRGVEATFSGEALDAADFADFLGREGRFALSLESEGTSGETSFSGGAGQPPSKTKASGGASRLELSVAEGRLTAAAEAADGVYDLAMDAPGAPNGVVTVAKFHSKAEFPLRRASEPQPWSATLELSELKADDALWAALDPVGALERQPLSFSADLAGEARVIADIGGASTGQSPVDLETLEIKSLNVAGLGASVNAKGALNIAGDAAFPEGEVEVDMIGVPALLGNLGLAGVLAPQEAAAYRSLVEQLAEPGGKPDELKATIRLTPSGVTVNGRPLQ